jgi:hypothetical protein
LFLNKFFVTKKLVDWSGRCETPAGSVGQVRPRRSYAPRRLTAHPAESEHPGAEINLYDFMLKATKFAKIAINF